MPPSSQPSGCFQTRLSKFLWVSGYVVLFLLAVVVTFLAARGVLGIIVVSFVIGPFVALTLLAWWVIKEGKSGEEHDGVGELSGLPRRFSYKQLRVATKDFEEKLGSGACGSVFKGVVKNEGGTAMIAVKRLDKLSQDMKEFLAEVRSIGSIHHFNLVKLIGYCTDHTSCRFLVYELMKNSSLEKWIFNREPGHSLSWQIRKKIVIDIARGLAYLHEDCRKTILHLDIKPQNILLDEHFNAKISDFGLSKLIERDESQVVTTMRGTPGYIAPEWQLLRITKKVDIYSFGIVLLEIICGRRNVDLSLVSDSHLLVRLERKFQEDKILEIVEMMDEDMQNAAEEVERMIKIAAWCLQDDHTKRPSISTLVKVLEDEMEMVEPNISFKFAYALTEHVVEIHHVSPIPSASVLSGPR